jgi:hypothetical protein
MTDRIDQLYRACAGAIGVEGWTDARLRTVRALVTPLDDPGSGPGPRSAAAVLLLAAARCLLAEGANEATHGAVVAAVRVWHFRPEPAAPAVPYWKRGDLA